MTSDKKRRNENAIKNPSAAVVIYNYKHRLGTPGLSEKQAHEVDQIIINTVSLLSASTSKSKSQPAGSFEIRLAPTKNWVNSITPGSWLVILMGQTRLFSKDTKYNTPTARQSKVKMLGRIESVRAVTAIDQGTGMITTEYVVSGEDWGGILNTTLYVDPLIRNEKKDGADVWGTNARMIYNNKAVGWGKDHVLPSSSENINALFSFWGKGNANLAAVTSDVKITNGRIGNSENRFRMPEELHKYFGFTATVEESSSTARFIKDGVKTSTTVTNPSGNFADIIKVIGGKLTKKDTGSNFNDAYEKVHDGASPVMFDTLLGHNSFWQLIMNNANHWINDTYAEMRWENGRAGLAIYNRIKPFANRGVRALLDPGLVEKSKTTSSEYKNNESRHNDAKREDAALKGLSDFVSPFKHIRTHEIARSDVMMVNVGSNWRDRYNFIEVNVSSGRMAGGKGEQSFNAETKKANQTFDSVAIGRDGFKPMIINAKFIPTDVKTKKLDPFRIVEYKVMNREWFFNLHRTLNGSLTLIGQDDYVAVGDNLIIDADAMFPGQNTNEDHINNKGKAYFLAHIESVSHNVSVNEVGARSFITEIQFVRGVITDKNGEELKKDIYLDENTHDVTPTQELNQNRVFSTSSGKDGKMDPDIQKTKGR